MEEKDLKQIGELFEKKLQEGLGQFWEDNLEPAFDKVYGEIDEVKDDLRVIEAKVNKALNIEYVRLEKRLKVVEQKLGITVPAENSP